MVLICILLLPLLLSLGGFHRRLRPVLISLAPWSALPALIWAVWTPATSTFGASWMFLGIHLAADDIGRSALIITSVLWLLVGLSAGASVPSGSAAHRFALVYLVTLTGMFGLCLAQDLPTFALWYALNTFAVYGFMMFEPTAPARRAGLIYIMLAVVGEMVLLEAFLHIISIAEDTAISHIPAVVATASERHLILGLILIGFGIKVGIFPLHVWMPIAYSAVPFTIGTILSGSMFLAGVLGWIRLLPLGMVDLPEWGVVCLVAGTITLLYGIAVGLTQTNMKALLAYSTIGQAGLLATGLGMGMTEPDRWPHIAPLLMMWPLHQAMAMGALFLGLGAAGKVTGSTRQRRWVAGGLIVSALAYLGLPSSGGALQHAIFEIIAPSITFGRAPLGWLPALGTIGMTLLMMRYLMKAWPEKEQVADPSGRPLVVSLWLPWAALIICDGIMLGVMRATFPAEVESLLFSPMAMWANIWPIAAGGLIAWGVIQKPVVMPAPRISPGDLVAGIEWLGSRAKDIWHHTVKPAWESRRSQAASFPLLHADGGWAVSLVEKVEEWLGQWMILGAALLVLGTIFFLILAAI